MVVHHGVSILVLISEVTVRHTPLVQVWVTGV